MKKTVMIDILNEQVMKLLQDLELLKLIRVHQPESNTQTSETSIPYSISRLKGAMTKQPVDEIEAQLNQFRNEWD